MGRIRRKHKGTFEGWNKMMMNVNEDEKEMMGRKED